MLLNNANNTNSWDVLIELHNELIKKHPLTAYLEICSQRRTGFMGHLCSDVIDNDPDRIRYACAGGLSGAKSVVNLVKDYCKQSGKDVPRNLRVDEKMSKLCSYENKLRQYYCFHYMEFMIIANPVDGFTFTVSYSYKSPEPLIKVSSKCHKEVVDLGIEQLNALISKLSSGKLDIQTLE